VDASPDGRWLAAGGSASTLYLWDLHAYDPAAQPIELAGHTSSVSQVRFFPERPWLASVDRAGVLLIWGLPARSGDSALFTLQEHQGAIDALAISADGRYLATGGRDSTVVLWDTAGVTPVLLARLVTGGDINSLAFDPQGARLAAGSADGRVYVWALEQPEAPPLELNHGQPVLKVTFDPDGNRLASGGQRGRIGVWNLQSADPAANPLSLEGHTREVRDLLFSPDGTRLASGGTDNLAILWDLRFSPPTGIFMRGHIGGVLRLLFSEAGDLLYTASTDGTVNVWNAANAAGQLRWILRGHEGTVRDMVFIPGGEYLATGSTDHRLRLWDLRAPSNAASPILLSGYRGDMRTLDISPDGRWLAAAGREGGRVMLWDLSAADPRDALQSATAHTDDLSMVLFSPDGRWLATTGGDRTILIWDVQAGSFTAPAQTLTGHNSRVRDLAFTPDSRLLLSASQDGLLGLWPLGQAQAPPFAPLGGHQAGVYFVTVHPQGCWAASGDERGEVLIWNLCAAEVAAQVIWPVSEDAGTVRDLAFSAGGNYLAAATDSGLVLLWQVDPQGVGAPFRLEEHSGEALSVAFSPDERWLASGSADSTIRLYDLIELAVSGAPGESFLLQAQGNREITDLLFVPQTTWLASAGADNHLRLWDLSDPQGGIQPLNIPGGMVVNQLAASPDGRLVASASRDGLARLVYLRLDALGELACRTAGRNLVRAEWDLYFPQEEYHKTCAIWP
jgi:WD40 repeat protein